MNNICKIIEDLLPLYIEGLTNEENTFFIDEHLSTCVSCKGLLDEMKEDLKTKSPISNDHIIDNKALLVAKIISKYQNILKLSLCSIIILFAVVITSIPITFFNTLALIVFTPFICRLLYSRSIPLLLVSTVCAFIGGTIVAGSLIDGWMVSIGQLLLMSIGIFAGTIFTRVRNSKETKLKIIIFTTFALILLTLGAFISSSFSGNPISYLTNHNKVSNYIKKTYPEQNVKITGIFYNWNDGSYFGKLSKGSELFTIDLYATGYIHDNYNISHANTYSESYARMIEVALSSNIKGQYFWVVAGSKKGDKTSLEDLALTSDMDLIIRFTTTNSKTPPLSVMSESSFLELSKHTVKVLGDFKLSYNNINFQAIDEDKKEMSFDLKDGIKKDSILKSKN